MPPLMLRIYTIPCCCFVQITIRHESFLVREIQAAKSARIPLFPRAIPLSAHWFVMIKWMNGIAATE